MHCLFTLIIFNKSLTNSSSISFPLSLYNYLPIYSICSILSVNIYISLWLSLTFYLTRSPSCLCFHLYSASFLLFVIFFSLAAVFFLTGRYSFRRVKDLFLIILTPFAISFYLHPLVNTQFSLRLFFFTVYSFIFFEAVSLSHFSFTFFSTYLHSFGSLPSNERK